MSFNPPLPPTLVPLRLVVPGVNTLAFAALPRWARKPYGAPGNPAADAVTTATLKALYQATRLAPARLRHPPPCGGPSKPSAHTNSTSTRPPEHATA
jgi:hypothetical protein